MQVPTSSKVRPRSRKPRRQGNGCRRGDCQLLDRLYDPRLIILPAAAQILWLRIAVTIGLTVKGGAAPELRIGSRILSIDEIAKVTYLSVSEVAPALDLLTDSGLLMREPDGALSVPASLMKRRRSHAA